MPIRISREHKATEIVMLDADQFERDPHYLVRVQIYKSIIQIFQSKFIIVKPQILSLYFSEFRLSRERCALLRYFRIQTRIMSA